MKALEGLKVLDFSQYHGASYTTMVLADFGADVLKVERVNGGDKVRQMAPKKDGYSLYHAFINRGKKSIAVDLTTEEGKEIVKELVKDVDVVCENFAYGTMEKLGLGYDTLKEINPKLVYASLTGYGREGVNKEKACFDNTAQAFAGMLDMTGYYQAEPIVVGMQLGNLYGGLHLALGIIYAVIHAEKTGEGQRVDVAASDSLFSALEDGMPDIDFLGHPHVRNGNVSLATAPYDSFPTKDGYVSIGVASTAQWEKFCSLFEIEEFLTDPNYATTTLRGQNYSKCGLKEAICAKTEKMTKFEVEELLGREAIPCGSVCTVEEAINGEQLQARNMVIKVQDNVLGEMHQPGVVQKMTVTPGTPSSAPKLGEHTESVLKSLGYSDEKIEELLKKNIVKK